MLDIAMALRLKGIADTDAIVHMTGAAPDAVQQVVATMIEAGHAKETPRGLMITPEGKEWVGGLLDEERESVDVDAMNVVYERFCEHNDDFKQLVTDWQMKTPEEPNDHSDADYDAAIFQRLAELDGQVAPVFADAAALAPRLQPYVGRFKAALEALQAGDTAMLSHPLKDSYHTIWFEMHEELILLSGRNRADEAAAGRGA